MGSLEMAKSLQEQLMGSGLVDKKQAKQIQKEKNENIRLMKLAEEEDKRRLESEKKIIEKHILADKKREEQELIEMKNTIELQEQKLLLELEEQAKADAHKYTQ